MRDVVQKETMDEPLQIGLWNVLDVYVWRRLKKQPYVVSTDVDPLLQRLWWHFLNKPIDTLPEDTNEAYRQVRGLYFSSAWNLVYDLLEFVGTEDAYLDRKRFVSAANSVLETHLSAYRFVGNQIAEITRNEEIAAVEEALDTSTPLAGVHSHLDAALKLVADREEPDHRNSIKESISAVEGLAKVITGDDNATLGAALKPIEQEIGINPTLKQAFSKLYGYTSGPQGIRHAMTEESDVGAAEAKYMLVACSAFVSYLIEKAAEAAVPVQRTE